MTLLKRSKREERPLLLSERPVLSDSCEDEGSKKKWKLFGKKSSATKNRKEEVIGWEPAPYFPKALQQTEQPRQKIKDNATTERLLEQQQKQKQEASKDDTTASITTARTNQSMSGPVTFNAVRRKANDKPLPQTATVLARSFGREASLLKGCTWVVQVSPAEWAPSESTWKYSIKIQQRLSANQVQDLTHGTTLRSLADFFWLQSALKEEFQGALLLPLLSIAVGLPDHYVEQEKDHPQLDSKLLAYWLSDVLNGIRGHGEICFPRKQNIIDSESMEAFLYRIVLSVQDDDAYSHLEHTPRATCNEQEGEDVTLWTYITSPELLCGGGPSEPSSSKSPPQSGSPTKRIFRRDGVTSKALGDSRTFQLQNSFVESAPTFDDQTDTYPSKFLPIIQVQRELTWTWRGSCLEAQKLLRNVVQQEKAIGSAWKRFAVSISNLFAYEKEVESARIGESSSSRSKSKLQNPYRKLHKSTVEDTLRLLALAKMDRSVPSLQILESMLNAYIADLSAIPPSMEAYLENLHTVRMIAHEQQQSGEEKKIDAMTQQEVQRLLNNEELLQQCLTTICQTAPLRTCRMAHKFLITEKQQSQGLATTADSLKQKINVASKESLAKLIYRHLKEEKEDKANEVALVQRMVHIGSPKMFSGRSEEVEEVEKGVELSKDDQNEEALKAAKRDNALLLCRERVGRWDAKLAMAVMDAVGIKDANVRVEETTRDLRLVRKYAIGLREHLEKCIEALEALVLAASSDVDSLRNEFMTELKTVFSTTFKPKSATNKASTTQSIVALQSYGIRVNDPSGWLEKAVGTCGGDTGTYLKARESGTGWLLQTLSDLLKEYNQRVESIESFVYMECVGIQMEKHFSQTRATALQAFEKKTDITSAINIATRKRMPALAKELKAKLGTVDVSHTTVKEAKEAHLESKALKQELNALALRRLTRARETSTERVIALLTVWSKEEEGSALAECKALETLIQSLELHVQREDLEAYMEASPSSSGL